MIGWRLTTPGESSFVCSYGEGDEEGLIFLVGLPNDFPFDTYYSVLGNKNKKAHHLVEQWKCDDTRVRATLV